MRRSFDILVSALVLIATGPLWLVVAIVVKLDSPGRVFYQAERVGCGGLPFTMYKFRTMRPDAAGRGPAVTAADDPRVTRVGHWLRTLKLDELPQFLNVLRGQMSLVGPRPESPYYVEGYTDEQRKVFSVRPGITSPATVHYRNEERLLKGLGTELEQHYVSVVLPAKLKIELDYIGTRSFRSDVGVLAATVKVIFRRSQPTDA